MGGAASSRSALLPMTREGKTSEPWQLVVVQSDFDRFL